MARLPRLDVPGVAQHVIQRGNNRQACFGSDQDFVAYAGWLHEYAVKHEVAIHAWVFMTNHVHLLVTPKNAGGVSALMQSVGRRYVPYFNYSYKRSGTLWEGRFRSCLVQSERYLLECYRYIELNPVRADMVSGPGDYKWSSYRCNGLGFESKRKRKINDILAEAPHRRYRQRFSKGRTDDATNKERVVRIN